MRLNFQRVLLSISVLLILNVSCTVYLSTEQAYPVSVNGEHWYFQTTSKSEYFVLSIVSEPGVLLPSDSFVNTSTCIYQFLPTIYNSCFSSRMTVSSYTAVDNNTEIWISVIPRGDSNKQGKLFFYFQPIQDISLDQAQVQNYQKHSKMFFRIQLSGSNKLFKLGSPFADQITEIYVAKQNCNDYSTGKTYTSSAFILDVLKDCEVIFSIQNRSYNDAFSFTPYLTEKVLLRVSSEFTTLIPSNIPDIVSNVPHYFRLNIQNLKDSFGFAAPMQLYLQLKGTSINDKFTVNLSSTVSLPPYNVNDAYCNNVNVCNFFVELSEGVSFFRYLGVSSNMYIQGVQYLLSALPVSFPPQGYQPTLFKSNRCLEFDFQGKNYQGVGVFYFTFQGKTAGDLSIVYENADGGALFRYYGPQYSENQYLYGIYYVNKPMKIQEAIKITQYTQGFDFFYKFIPLQTIKQTSENIEIQKPWTNYLLSTVNYAAQIESYVGVLSASVRITLTGFSYGDLWSVYVNDGPTCSTSYNLPTSRDYCKYYKNISTFDYTYSIYENRPVYFQLAQQSYEQGQKLNVIFSVNCISGFKFNGALCVLQTAN